MYTYLIMALSQCPIIRQGGVNKLDLLHRVLGIHNRRALIRIVQLHVNSGHFKQERYGRVHLFTKPWSISFLNRHCRFKTIVVIKGSVSMRQF